MDGRARWISRRSFLALTTLPLALAAARPHAAEAMPGQRVTHRAIALGGWLSPIDAREHARELRRQGKVHRATKVYGTNTIATTSFSMLALSWHAGSSGIKDLQFLVRTRDGLGWSGWREMHPDGHGPDPHSTESRGARSGTEPLLVGASTAVQVRIETLAASPPAQLQVDAIDLGETPDDVFPQVGALTSTSLTPPYAPTILTRADWGADETIRDQSEPSYGDIRGLFVHHTAGSNGYSAAAVPSIINGIYVYHVLGRGWRDIGYNFLLDRFGRIWEGRYGGIDAAVVGAHTAGYNSNAFGAAVLGDYTSTELSAEALMAYRDLAAWKFRANDVLPTESVAYPAGRTLPTIAGHRDAVATECPGQRAYNQLPRLRRDVSIAMIRVGGLPTLVPIPRGR